jgi:hypothetical protein
MVSRQPSRMNLAAVKRGVIDAPIRTLIYGVEGIGKSTASAGAPSPIFLGAEEGANRLDVARLPEPQTWAEVLEAPAMLAMEEHQFQTLVIDTIDSIEPLIWAHVVRLVGKPGVRTIEDMGYGKGYIAALNEWHLLLSALDRLRRAKNMGIVLVGHAQIKRFSNPDGMDFDRYSLKVHEKAGGLLRGWSDAVLFAQWETYVAEDERTKKGKGVSTGARLLYTQRTASFDAKNRFGLPERLPLSWRAYADAIGAPKDPSALAASVTEKLEQLGDEALTAKVTAYLAEKPGDITRLVETLNRLDARIQEKGAAE